MATALDANGFAGLPTLGFLPSDYATAFPARVIVDQAAGTVQKFDASGASMGTDTVTDVPRSWAVPATTR